MVTTSKQIEEWIQQEHTGATRLLGYASGGGSYSARAEQAMRAALMFKRCEAFAEIRARLAMADYITARIQEVRDDKEPAAVQALADECERLLAAGAFDTAWGWFRDGGLEGDALCNPDDCFWWGEDEITLPELPRLAAYERLHDGLSNMIEGGRLREAEIPDDYRWLAHSLAEIASMEGREAK